MIVLATLAPLLAIPIIARPHFYFVVIFIALDKKYCNKLIE
jgi:hypothetical protein